MADVSQKGMSHALSPASRTATRKVRGVISRRTRYVLPTSTCGLSDRRCQPALVSDQGPSIFAADWVKTPK